MLAVAYVPKGRCVRCTVASRSFVRGKRKVDVDLVGLEQGGMRARVVSPVIGLDKKRGGDGLVPLLRLEPCFWQIPGTTRDLPVLARKRLGSWTVYYYASKARTYSVGQDQIRRCS